MSSKRRVFQIAQKVRIAIASELARTADPRFNLVTVTSVVVSSDLRHAKVYWIVSGDEARRKEVEKAFEGATGLFRRVVAGDLGVRFVPELRFYYDDTFDTYEEVDRLFRRINGEISK